MPYDIVSGRRVTVTERGWFAPPYAACRFAGEAAVAIRVGYDLPLNRQSPGPNAVRDLQLAGDPTPQNGSTLRQGQRALKALLPADAPIYFGRMSEAEVIDAVHRGATVAFAVHMPKMPRYLRRFCGYGYDGDHYEYIDWADADGENVALNDPMFRPAGKAHPQTVALSEIRDAVIKDAAGNWIVCFGFESAALYQEQMKDLQSQLADAEKRVLDVQGAISELQAKMDAIQP